MSITQATSATESGRSVADRTALVLAGALGVIGLIALVVASAFHPSGIENNNHPAVFAQYAQSSSWTAVHLAEFAAMAITITGLLVLFYALNLADAVPSLVARIGAIFAGVALALTAVRFAVDGVVLKRAVDAWVGAPDLEKAARFASAETVRWLEEAITSYQSFLLGLTLILLAVLIVWTARVPRLIGYLLALGGIGYLVVGWINGVAGLAPEGAIPTYIGQLSPVIASVYLLIIAWRMPRSAAQRAGEG
jgi:hypothetical protein